MAEEKKQCAGVDRVGETWNKYNKPCGNAGTLEHEGRWWCKRHHPPSIEARHNARSKAFHDRLESERAAQAELERRSRAYDAALTWANLATDVPILESVSSVVRALLENTK